MAIGMRQLILIEGMPKYEGINEAKALADALRLMMKGYDRRTTRGLKITQHTAKDKEDFLRWLERKTDFLHISSHGRVENGRTILYLTQGGKITADDIENLQINAKVVFVNACQVSRRDLANAFFKAGEPKRRFYIAPRVDVPFDEAFLVALLFYKKAFLEKRRRLLSALNYVYKLKDVKTNYWIWEGP
jgi:hypothetical protein